jgi:hypothetical protein
MIRLCDLLRYKRLPAYQELNGLVDVDEKELDDRARIHMFVSHRWIDHQTPDDGSLIGKIFDFCLGVVVKNNFQHLLPKPPHLHHSKSLSDKLTSLVREMDPVAVLADGIKGRIQLQDYAPRVASLPIDSMDQTLVAAILDRFYIWIDYCCLPQNRVVDGKLVARTPAEERQFYEGLDSLNQLLKKTECVIFWPPSEFTRAWCFYEALMSVPSGLCSFHMPMEQITAFSTVVRRYHNAHFSEGRLMDSLMMIDTFKKVGIAATSHWDVAKIIFLLGEGLVDTEWRFRIIQ